jgi:tetratricopeptide (TPR) repeat protein
MADNDRSQRGFRPEQAEAYYKQGLDLKSQGLSDRALTEFRRAVLADSRHAKAHFEIGLLVKFKANTEPLFLRHAFEAFRQAARLDLNNQAAHDQYIMLGQKMGVLDDLHREYDTLAKEHPEIPYLAQCAKNIVNLSLAMVPGQVSVGNSDTSSFRRLILIVSIGFILLGIGLILWPLISRRMGNPMTNEQMSQLIKVGIAGFVAGTAGFFIRARLH